MRPAKVEVFEEGHVDCVLHVIVPINDDAVGYVKAGHDDADVASIDGALSVVTENPRLDTFEAVGLGEFGAKFGVRGGHEVNESGGIDWKSLWSLPAAWLLLS